MTRLDVSVYTIPTDQPESDGTLAWDSTTAVVVEAHESGRVGLGYTYCDAAAAEVVRGQLAGLVEEAPLDPRARWLELGAQVRNAGRPGIAACAISAVDQALWDLKARLLGVSLADLLGAAREEVPIYGSGGFCSYSLERLREQLGGWAAQGIPRVKMKVARDPVRDPARLDAAREAIGDDVELYVDANGAFPSGKQALAWAERYAREWGVSWFEEPVSSADFEGLRLLRDRGPAGLEIAAGEYAYVPADFRNIVGVVDCLQADVTRCGGITGLLHAAGLATAYNLEISGHCAPAASLHPLCAVTNLRNLEYFHDHVRVEAMLFDGAVEPDGGVLRPDRARPGNGLELKARDNERFLVGGSKR